MLACLIANISSVENAIPLMLDETSRGDLISSSCSLVAGIHCVASQSRGKTFGSVWRPVVVGSGARQLLSHSLASHGQESMLPVPVLSLSAVGGDIPSSSALSLPLLKRSEQR